jgi:small subunit ribosomal protein S8
MMTDPVADMLTRIRNGLNAKMEQVVVPASILKERIARIMKDEGFLNDVEVMGEGKKKSIVIKLKYTAGKKSVVSEISKISKLGRRVYLTHNEIRPVKRGRGIAILSTSKGVMKDTDAKKNGVGGELLCQIW